MKINASDGSILLLVGLIASAVLVTATVHADDDGPRLAFGSYGLRFDGERNYIDLGNTGLTRWDSWTFEAWVSLDDLDSRNTVFGLHEGHPYLSVRVEPDGNINVWHRDERNRRLVGSTSSQPFAGRVNEWVHLAVAVDRDAARITVYIDGREEDVRHTTTDAVESLDFARNPSIGGMSTDGGTPDRWHFAGLLADVRVWDRVRTPSEVEAYADRRLTYREDGLVGHWPLNEGQGDVASDRGPDAIHGKVDAGAWAIAEPLGRTVVPLGSQARLLVQLQDERGRPVETGAYADVVTAEDGMLEPLQVDIPQGESTVTFRWSHDVPGTYRLTAAHDRVQGDTLDIHVTGPTRLAFVDAPDVVQRDEAVRLTVQVQDEEGRPIDAGSYQNVIAVAEGADEPVPVAIAEGKSTGTYIWTPPAAGLYILRAEHADLADAAHEIRVGYVEALRHESEVVRLRALEALGQDGPTALEEVADGTLLEAFSHATGLLGSDDPEVRRAASAAWGGVIDLLRKHADGVAIAVLIDVLKTAPCPDVRATAVHALGIIGDESAVEDLVAALSSKDWLVRLSAREALEAMGQAPPTQGVEEDDDWPMWRYGPGRGAATPRTLTRDLRLQWILQLPQPSQGWHPSPDHPGKLTFDASYQPVVANATLIIPSMIRDSVTAYCVDSGEEKWRFYADGPIRFAPVAADGRVYAVSDDGYLYCLDGDDGRLLWKRRGGPSERRVLGNDRLINTWPARGGPVLKDGVVYFAAGIWPFMGVFVHAIDAETGDVIWTNSHSGLSYAQRQVFNDFSGVAPQGYLAIEGDTLLVASGLTVPAGYDRHTGDLRYYQQIRRAVGRRGIGGYRVMAQGPWFFNHGSMYSLADGAAFGTFPEKPVLSGDAIIGVGGDRLVAYAAEPEVKQVATIDRWQREAIQQQYSLVQLLDIELSTPMREIFLKAGHRLYGASRDGHAVAVELPSGEVSWHAEVEGEVATMVAASGRLFVVTTDGAVYCFGAGERQVTHHDRRPRQEDAVDNEWSHQARRMLERTKVQGGYALVLGGGSLELLEALARESDLRIVAIEPDRQAVQRWRRKLDERGLYGSRVAVHPAEPAGFTVPPYLADLIVCGPAFAGQIATAGEDRQRWTMLANVFEALRPYGGVAWLTGTAFTADDVDALLDEDRLAGARLEITDDGAILERHGPLPGAGQWTHEHADSANTVYSGDERVKAPMGLLWFGGPSNERVLPRHGDGPIPHVVDGRLIIMGPDHLTARCIYTGREIWQTELPGVGAFFDSAQHQPGSNLIGSNYVSVSDGIYVVHDKDIHHLDAVTGEKLASFRLTDEEGKAKAWGAPRVWDDLLIVPVGPEVFEDGGRIGGRNLNHSASRYLAAVDRFSGELLWKREARYVVQHNAVAVAAGRVYLIDALRDGVIAQLQRRGITVEQEARLIALDARTGELVWENDAVFGTWLSYSEEHDILLQAGRGQVRKAGHALSDEPDALMKAHRGSDGEVIWARAGEYLGPLNLLGEMIVTSSHSRGESAPFVNLLTGEKITRAHPLTDEPIAFTYRRDYGCGTTLAAKHLLTFRSGSAGYYDLMRQGGTGNFGGFRAGCTNNLVPADGVLNAPDYTRTCRCPFQNQTSLALVHAPQAEVWTYDNVDEEQDGIRRVGINFGAPGNRRSEDGLLWLNYTGEDGIALFAGTRTERHDVFREDIPMSLRTPKALVQVEYAPGRRWFRNHSGEIKAANGDLPWVAASGVEGATRVTLKRLDHAGDRTYTVRLHFTEPATLHVGERVFDVLIQGQRVVHGLDTVRQAGRENRPVIFTFEQVVPNDDGSIDVELVAADGSLPPIISGIEVRIESESTEAP